MKKILLLIALIATIGITAQEQNPSYTVVGEMVKATYYHTNGTIAQTGFFVNEKLHGEWKMYNDAGKKIAMGQYNNGVKIGKWFFWKGENLSEVDYSDNRIAKAVQWNNSESMVLNK